MGIEKHQELSARTKSFALRIMRMSDALPKTRAGNVVGHQILRSATSVAANYRAAGRARSKAEFIAKIGIVIEEADETVLWLELLAEGNVLQHPNLRGCSQKQDNCWPFFQPPGARPRNDNKP